MVHVVNHIISLSRDLVNQGDCAGWTPLLWAARGTNTTQARVSSSAQEKVIKLLLDRGADPCAISKGPNRGWSPVKVARYHGVDSRVIRLLEERAKDKLETTRSDNVWDEKFHASRQADQKEAWCGCCFAVSTLPTLVLVPS